MQILTFDEIRKLDDGAAISGTKGKLKSVFQRRGGTTNNREWSFQDGVLVDGGGSEFIITFNNRPDMEPYKGTEIYVLSTQGKKGLKGVTFKVETFNKDGQRQVKEKIFANDNAEITTPDQSPPANRKDAEAAKPAPTGKAVRYWIQTLDGTIPDPYMATAEQLQQSVNDGVPMEVVAEGDEEWTTPEHYGFKKIVAPKTTTPPPRQSALSSETANAKDAKIQAIIQTITDAKKAISRTSVAFEMCFESTLVMMKRIHQKHPELHLFDSNGKTQSLSVSDLKEISTATCINAFWSKKPHDVDNFPVREPEFYVNHD